MCIQSIFYLNGPIPFTVDTKTQHSIATAEVVAETFNSFGTAAILELGTIPLPVIMYFGTEARTYSKN